MAGLLADAALRGQRYVGGLDSRQVAPSPAALAALKELTTPLHAHPLELSHVLQELDDVGSPETLAVAGAGRSTTALRTRPVGFRRSMG